MNLSLTAVKREKMIQSSKVPGKNNAVKKLNSLEQILSAGDLEMLDEKIQAYSAMGEPAKDENTVTTDAFTVDTLSLPGEDGLFLLGPNNSEEDKLCRETKEGRSESSLSRHLSKIRKPFLSGNRIKKREYREAVADII